MELPFQKFNGLNFHTWQVKTQMRLMHEGLWDIVHTGGGDDDTKKDKAKAIIGLALSDSYIHFIDLTKTPKEIWDRLSGFFGNSAAISLKSQLYSLKMQDGTSLSSHINDLMSLKGQLAEIKEKQKQKHENEKQKHENEKEKDENQLAEIKEKEKQKHENGKEKDEISGDADFIANILNSLSSKYSNAVFTISQLSLMSLINQLAEIKEKEKKQLAEIKEKEKEKEKKQLAEIKEKEKEKHENEKEKDEISDADFIAIILNSLSSKYSNAVSTLSQLPSKSLDKTIATLLAEEKRMNAEDTDGGSQTEMALLSKGRMKRGLVEYSYYHKSGHTALNCRIYK